MTFNFAGVKLQKTVGKITDTNTHPGKIQVLHRYKILKLFCHPNPFLANVKEKPNLVELRFVWPYSESDGHLHSCHFFSFYFGHGGQVLPSLFKTPGGSSPPTQTFWDLQDPTQNPFPSHFLYCPQKIFRLHRADGGPPNPPGGPGGPKKKAWASNTELPPLPLDRTV
jgi:hypothetical protein